MAVINPFKGIRPANNKSQLVPTRSIENYTTAELHSELVKNPYSFLNVINPDFSDHKTTKAGSDERLQKIKAKFHEFIKSNILIQESKACYYIYRQNNNANEYTGIIAAISIDDYFNGTIKIHEQTFTERVEKLKHYLAICKFNADPVSFCYPDDNVINEIVLQSTSIKPEYDFTTSDNIHHQLWLVSDVPLILQISKRFSEIKNIYIADGHHRSASSALLGKSRRNENPNFTGTEPFNFYLGILFSETQLKIFDYNRVIKDLNNLSVEEFISKISEKFIVTEKGTEIYKPIKKYNVSMYLDGKWYSLDAKQEIIHKNNPEADLDASLLSEYILSPILDINDLRKNKRIGFISGMKGMEELKKQIDMFQYKVAFALYPVKMEQLKYIADTNSMMPPKTTWVEPKMRSGLVVYNLV